MHCDPSCEIRNNIDGNFFLSFFFFEVRYFVDLGRMSPSTSRTHATSDVEVEAAQRECGILLPPPPLR